MPKVVIASSVVFVVLNFLENMIHYAIGAARESQDHTLHLVLPTYGDIIKIIVTMVVFAILQGVCTSYFIRYL